MIPTPSLLQAATPTGTAVPEGFTLPWNTTRTMADVWRPKHAKTHVQKNRGRPKGIIVAPKIRYAGREE